MTAARHDDQCEGPDCRCYARKLRTIQFGNVQPPPERAVETQREKDLPAYQRLRRQGLQPKATRGCAELETRAHSQFEIDMHKLVEPTLWKRAKGQITETMAAVQEGMREARELGVTTQDVKGWRDTARTDKKAV